MKNNRSVSGRRVSSLKGLLFVWVGGGVLLLVFLYTNLLDYYFRFGISLRTKISLESVAQTYARSHLADPTVSLPTGRGLIAYRTLESMPRELEDAFKEKDVQHDEVDILYADDDPDEREEALDSEIGLQLCGGSACELIFLYAYQIKKDEWLYLVQGTRVTQDTIDRKEVRDWLSFLLALSMFALFSVLLVVVLRKIGRPVQSLASWAESLSVNQLSHEPPDFKYRELNSVAQRLSSAFGRMALSVQKEKDFLRHASHELRTPIAVASGNLELLEKMAQHKNQSLAEQQAFNRLKDSVKDMQQLTETLLWLHREAESLPVAKTIDLKHLIQKIVEDNQYLLNDKAVEVSISGDGQLQDTPEVLCRIIFSNLLRNAFQYTHRGVVNVAISGQCITVQNINYDNHGSERGASEGDADYGFGLGLGLVDQMVDRLGWQYAYKISAEGRSSSVYFSAAG